VTDKYAVIAAEKATTYPITSMCDWLGVSRAGYYEWRTRPASATARRRSMLGSRVVEIFEGSRGTYGARRIAAELAARGRAAGVRQVASIMREHGLVAYQPRPYKRTTFGDRVAAVSDLLARDLTAQLPHDDDGGEELDHLVQAEPGQRDRGRQHPGDDGDRGLGHQPGHGRVL